MKGLRPGWAVKALVVALLLRCFSDAAAATNHSVGGAFGWDLSSDLQEWASQATFHVGDSLVFSYTQVHEVLEVKNTDYDMCHTGNPLKTHKDGATVIPLMEEGDRYFMCGRLSHCAMGLKLRVRVLPQLRTDSNATSSEPRPSPTADISGDGPHATSKAPGPSPSSSHPQHESRIFSIACLGMATLINIMHPIYNGRSILTNGWGDEVDAKEYTTALLTSEMWFVYEVKKLETWEVLSFKALIVSVELFCMVIVVFSVSIEKRVRVCIYILVGDLIVPALTILLVCSMNIMGLLAATINVIMFYWPIKLMKKKWSEETADVSDELSLTSACGLLVLCMMWTAFGVAESDYYILVANVIGVGVAVAEIVFLKVYQHGEEDALLEPLLPPPYSLQDNSSLLFAAIKDSTSS